MGVSVAELSAELGLDANQFTTGLNRLPAMFGPVGTAAIAASAVAVAALAAIGIAAVKLGGQFDEAYDTIRIDTGATGAALDGLEEDFKAVVKSVPTDFGSASTAIADLNTRLGLTGEPLQEVATQFLELSRITGTDVAENIRLGTRLFGDWSIATEDQSASMDQLFRASQQSGIGMSDLMETIVQFGAPLRNMGFGFSESIGMLAKWEKEGVNTETVLTGMKFALKTFAKAGEDPQKALAELIPKMRDMKDEQAAMTLGMETFGLRAGPDMVAAIREGRFEYEDFAASIAGGSDTIAKAAADTADWGEKLTVLKNRALVGLEPLAMAAFDALGAGMDAVSAAFDYLGEHKDILVGVGAALVGLATAGPALALLAGTLRAAAVASNLYAAGAFKMAAMTKLAAVGQWVLNAALAASPFVIIAALIAGLVVLYLKCETFRNAVNAVASTLRDVLGSAVSWIVEKFRAALPTLSVMWDEFKATLVSVWGYVKQFAKIVGSAIAAVVGFIRRHWGTIGPIVRNVWNIVEAVVGGALKVVASLIRAVMAAIRGDWSGAWGHIKAALKTAWDAMKTVVRNALSALKGILTGLGRKILGWMGDLGGLLLDAGRALIGGLLKGITEKFEEVKTFVSGIATWIKDNKGPLDYDRVLLRPAGQAIMDGLMAGIDDRIGAFYSQLSGVTAGITVAGSPRFAMAGVGASGGGAEIHEHIHVHLPGGTTIVGAAETVGEILAPHVGGARDEAARRRRRRR